MLANEAQFEHLNPPEKGNNMIDLYGSGQARSFRALWALEEADLSYNYHHIKFGSEQGPLGALSAEYISLNSQGKVPTLIDGDLVITQSAAILNYIAATNPDKKLTPQDNVKLRAKYDEVCFFVLSDLEQPVSSIGKHRFALPEEFRIEKMADTAAWEFKRSLKALAQYLSEKEKYVFGTSFSMADILVAHTLNMATNFGMDIPDTFSAYKDRMYKRPACQKALKILRGHQK